MCPTHAVPLVSACFINRPLHHRPKLPAERVLVPLCGKTVDLPYLASKGACVVGVEGVRRAVDEFEAEQPQWASAPATRCGGFTVRAFEGRGGGKVTVFVGDFFQMDAPPAAAAAGRFDGAWDRGAFVAIEPSARPRYAEVLANLMEPGGRVLLCGEAVAARVGGWPRHETTPHVKS